MTKENFDNEFALLILCIFYQKINTKLNLSLDNKNLKWGGGGYHYEIYVFLKNTLDNYWHPSKISLKYISIHIQNFEHCRVIMNMKLSSHGFLFHRNINRKESKAQISLIITIRKI